MSILERHWFLLLLGLVLAVGMGGAPWLEGLLELPRSWVVAVVMFVTALPMSFTQLTRAARSGYAVGLALVLSMVVAPLIAWPLGRLLPEPLAMGLLIAASVPCTQASAAVWTRRGGGNDAIALFVTLVTHFACFLILPGWIWLLSDASVTVDAREISEVIVVLVLVPVTAAQVMRRSTAVLELAAKYRVVLSVVAQLGILVMVFFSAISAGVMLREIDPAELGPLVWVGLGVLTLALHLILFAMGWFGSRMLGAPWGDQLAVAISGSQKTLMIGLEVALMFGGLAALPIITYHVLQLIADTMLVDRLKEEPRG
jgi:sodium/bile acid cotransporter 7